jgi:hypothetical protein
MLSADMLIVALPRVVAATYLPFSTSQKLQNGLEAQKVTFCIGRCRKLHQICPTFVVGWFFFLQADTIKLFTAVV